MIGGPSRGTGRGRTDWGAVFGRVPKQFSASHVRQVRGLKEKLNSEIAHAIARWTEKGLVKRKARGLYERA
jgi:hypothetical protein